MLAKDGEAFQVEKPATPRRDPMGSVSLVALMVAISTLADVQLLFFSSQACMPCQQVKPVVAQLANEGYPVVSVDIHQRADLANQYQVQQIPCFVLTVRGQEVSRLVGLQSASALKTWMQASLSLNVAGGTQPNIQQPNIQVPTAVNPGVLQDAASQMLAAGQAAMTSSDRQLPIAGRSSLPQNRGVSESSETRGSMTMVSTQSASQVQQNALSATVRIHVDEPQAFAVGSGTVIHQDGEFILILTCGHLFREAGAQAKIKVDAGFPQQVVAGLDARVRYYDSEQHDIALVVAHTQQRFAVAKIAPQQLRLNPGDQVFGVGCSAGDAPTILTTRVKALTNYSGVTKVDTFVRPDQGRSGGGLFTAGGQLIGVCNAAAVNVDEGIYAGAQSIYAALDAANLREMVTGPAPQLLASDRGNMNLGNIERQGLESVPAAGTGNGIPRNSGSARASGIQQRGIPGTGSAGQLMEPLAIPVRSSATPEITILIRSANDPNQAEIMTLTNPSTELLQMLRREQQRTNAAGADSRLRSMTRPPRDANIRAQSPEGTMLR